MVNVLIGGAIGGGVVIALMILALLLAPLRRFPGYLTTLLPQSMRQKLQRQRFGVSVSPSVASTKAG